MFTRHVPKVLITAGGLLILVAVMIKWDSSRRQAELVHQDERFVVQLAQQTVSTPAEEDEVSAPDEPAADSVEERASEPPENLIGILSIPRVDLPVAIGEGTDGQTLLHTVGHFPQTAEPGEPWNFALTGHRGHIFGPFLLRLGEVEVGDAILVKSGAETFTYKVTEAFAVEPTETCVLDPADGTEISPKYLHAHLDQHPSTRYQGYPGSDG